MLPVIGARRAEIMPSTPQTTNLLSSTRPPRARSPIDLRWYQLLLVAVGLAVATGATLAFEAPDTTRAVTSIPASYPDTTVDDPWYEPQPPCWITSTCPRA
jgi:hypothetical protein